MNTKHTLVISILVHVLIALTVLHWAPKNTSIPKEVLEFELKTMPKHEAAAHRTNFHATAHRMKSTPSSTQLLQKLLIESYTPNLLKEAGPTAVLNPNAKRGRSNSWEEPGYTTNDDPSIAWGAGSGTFERIQDIGLMAYFHDKVDSLLFYPGILARKKMTGTVNTRIVLTEDGSCDWRRSTIAAANPYFRVYILQLLKKVCSENFKKYTKNRLMTNIDMSFAFVKDEDITTKELIEKNQYVVGNVLMFYRHARNSIAEWHLGPLTGIFPLPFVSVDFDWLTENYENYFEQKNLLDDYRAKTEESIERY
jgi:hypothetical protein